MQIIKSILFITTLLLSTFAIGQSSIEDLVKEGISYHDKGEYDKAIEQYEKAFAIDPESALVNYELAFSHFKKENYKKAIKYSDTVIKQNKDLVIQAYLTKGSSLDMLGKTKQSIKLFEEGIKKLDGHYLMYFNLALNYYKLKQLDEAEYNVIKAIEENSNHSSSHLLLANLHNIKGNSVQTILSSYFFLFLEPNTGRSAEAYQMLKNNFSGNVSKDEKDDNTINITLPSSDDDEFATLKLMIAMIEASKTLEENKDKTEEEMFIENTASLFNSLGELKNEKSKEIWWTFYTPFFYDLAKSDHLATYCNYICQSSSENSQKWLSENEEKLKAFDDWLKNK